MPLDQFELSSLHRCKCGGVPCEGSYFVPETHFANCPECGAWAQGDTADEMVAAWNVQMRPRPVVR
jgi:hypothetical protein